MERSIPNGKRHSGPAFQKFTRLEERLVLRLLKTRHDAAGVGLNRRVPEPKVFLGRCGGFTLIELMIVMTIISILVSIALPIANSAILRAKEAVLKSNLHTLRLLIDQYTADKQKAPQALEDLVSAGYLRAIPKDPITNSAETWQTVNEDVTLFPEQTEVGISDVHSGSEATSSEGTAYNSW